MGIDEAGYGPNLGPLVMTAVIAESPDDRPPDLWTDLAATVCRAGVRGASEKNRLWIDDSKAIYKAGLGRDRLEAGCLAAVSAAGFAPETVGELLEVTRAGTLDDVELIPWINGLDPPVPSPASRPRCDEVRRLRPLDAAPWRIIAIRSIVIGPRHFNAALNEHGSKAQVHFGAFARLLNPLWTLAEDGVATFIRGDKHGGRHFYFAPLSKALPDAWIDRGVEGPDHSHYTLRDASRRLEIRLLPRADAGDGLVALASIVSKAIREFWMDAFNAYWTSRLPGLRPTAGYPVDALRFRQAIEAHCLALGLSPADWWRFK